MFVLPTSYLPGIRWPSLTSVQYVHLLALQFQLEQTQWLPPDELLALQLMQVQPLVRHAQATVPFYRQRLAPLAGLKPSDVTYNLFQQLPVLRRSDIQTAGTNLHSQNVPAEHGKVLTNRTSGSTARPIQVRGTAITASFFRALGLRYHLWHKRDFSGKNMTIRSAQTMKMEHPVPGWADGYDSGPVCRYPINRPTRELFAALIKEDPDYLQTHPGTLRELIRWSQETGRKPNRLREARTFGEVLSAEIREMAARQWEVAVSDNYSATEVGIIALQCPDQKTYHAQAESLLVEILDDDGTPCRPGQIGRVVCTDLHNFAMPLIRYEIGDFAEVATACACGRGLPTLRRIVGRFRSLLVLPSGDRMHPDFSSKELLKIMPIRQFQLTQKALHEIEIKLVTARPPTAAEEQQLADYFNRQFRHEFAYRFAYCDEIPRSASGKFDVFRSEIAGQGGA